MSTNRRPFLIAIIAVGLLICGGLVYTSWKPAGTPMTGLPTAAGLPTERKSVAQEKLLERLHQNKFADLGESWKDENRRYQDLVLMQKLRFDEFPGLLANADFQNLLFVDIESDKPSMRNEQLAIRLLGRFDQTQNTARLMTAFAKRQQNEAGLYYSFQGTSPYPSELKQKINKIMIKKDVGLSRDVLLLATVMTDQKAQLEIFESWARDYDKIFSPLKPYVFKTLSENPAVSGTFRKDKKLWSKRLAAGKGPVWDELRAPAWQQQIADSSTHP